MANRILKTLLVGLAGATVMLDGAIALAAAGAGMGTIAEYHLNGAIENRSTCIRMSPELPTTGGWACLYKSNGLNQEINNGLLQAYLSGKTCTVGWSNTDSNGYGIIDYISCVP